MSIESKPLRYYAENPNRKRRSVLLSEIEEGKGLRVVAKNDPKHIAEHAARVEGHAERIRKIMEGD